MHEVITENLDLWTSALLTRVNTGRSGKGRSEAHGIKKLRELILELAVRGKLVPQDVNAEPASVLLTRIAKEKARLVREGAIGKKPPLLQVSDDEKFFDLPNGWAWTRFGDVFELEYGSNLPEAKRQGTGDYPVYGSNGVVGLHDSFCVDRPCIVVGRKGSAGALNLCVSGKCWVTDVAYSVVPPSDMDLEFVFKLFHTLGLSNLGKGIKPGLNRNEAYALPIAIPPLSEQRAIVAKVNELMSLCDELDRQQAQTVDAHQTLVEALIGTLARVASAQDLSEAWYRIAGNFDTLLTTEQSIDYLRQTILQLAVRGMLARQDPADEPATTLLNSIAAEKALLAGEGKIRKETPGKLEARAPFVLPNTWVWSELAALFAVITDGDHQAPPQSESGIPFLVIGNLSTGAISFSGCKFVPTEYYEGLDWGRKPVEGDLLYTVTGSFGIPVPVDTDKEFCVQRHVAILKAARSTPRRYLELVLASRLAIDYAESIATGIAQKTVPLTGLRRMPIPIPPEAEQRRIVARVDELMSLCDALQAAIRDAQATQSYLAEAVVEQAVA